MDKSSVFILVICGQFSYAMAEDCTSILAAVLISVSATLVVVAMILLMIYLCYKKSKKGETHIKRGIDTYDNPTFTRDIESGQPAGGITLEPNQPGYEGYTLCREYADSLLRSSQHPQARPQQARPQQQQQQQQQQQTAQRQQEQYRPQANSASTNQYSQIQTRSNDTQDYCTASLKTPRISKFRKSMKRVGLSQRTGSHSSLDYRKEPELVSVYLETRDPSGFGMFIDGNMRDGIFISKVQNRGPAKETGLIDKGDRIINMTISMENMVLEDALTIVSYASPYPVRLLVRKVDTDDRYYQDSSSGSLDSPTLENSTSTTPGVQRTSQQYVGIYRSQSLNDLSVIVKDSILPCNETSSIKGFSPRRARSEIKRPKLKPASFYDSEMIISESSENIQELYPSLTPQDHMDLVQLSYESDAIEHDHNSMPTPELGFNESDYKINDDTKLKSPIRYQDKHQYIEIERTPIAKDIMRGGNSSSGGMSYFFDIDSQDDLKAPIMNTAGFVVKESPGNNNQILYSADSQI